MTVLAFLVVLGAALLAGRSAGRSLVGPDDGRAWRFVVWLAAGLVGLHVVLAWLDLAGVPWHPALVLGVVAGATLAGRRWIEPAPAFTPTRGGVGDEGGRRHLRVATLVSAAVVGYFGILAVSQRIAFPDFVYHWGIKGHRYFLARGIDYDFLVREWNLVAHRDYPQLVPELYALQSMISGRFSEPLLLLWSAVFFAAVLIAARAALDVWSVRDEVAGPTVALLAFAVGVFAVGHQMAGSVDWIIALALVAALPALVRAPSARGELQLGVLAALAASSKLEGIPLAVILIAAGLWKRLRAGRSPSLLAATLRVALPMLVAVTPWLAQGLRHDLFRDPQSGAFDAGRAPAIAAALWEALLRPEWHLVPLVLLLLPLLFLRPETRLAGVVVGLQLGGYLLRYFTATFDYEFSVLSSFPRLAFHLLPAVVVGLAVVADRWAEASAAPTPEGRLGSAE